MPATSTHTSRAHSAVLLTTAGAAALLAWVVGIGSALAPEPATTRAVLTGSTGATAAAVILKVQPSTVVKWGTAYTYCPSTLLAGTPCSNSNLLEGEKAYKRIERSGTNCRCSDYIGSASKVQTTLLMTPLTSANGNRATGVSASAKDTFVILWPTSWYAHVNNAVPVPGTPCSPTAMAAGQRTFQHIQGYVNTSSTYRRCVPNTWPLWSQ